MKGKKIIIISIIINILTIGIIYNFIKKDYFNNEKIIVKAMTETEYENSITSLNTSHEDFANYIEESKAQIASAITDMGVTTSNDDSLETMASNIRNIQTNEDAASINYDNTNSGLTATNVQGAVDELNDSLGQVKTYVGSDGKLHFVDASGADSVLPFNKDALFVCDALNFSGPTTLATYDISTKKKLQCITYAYSTKDAGCIGIYVDGILICHAGGGVDGWGNRATVDITGYNTLSIQTFSGNGHSSPSGSGCYAICAE